MKERLFISAFILVYTFLLSISSVTAENWVLIEDMGVGKVMMDADSIKEDRSSTVGAWIKIISNIRSYADPKAVKEVVTYYEFDCKINVYRTKNPTYYFSDGSKEKTKETSSWESSEDSLTLTLKEYLCK
ncbi:MAG: surface-adhesin E family protein [Thermodesulfovibrionales bacterium]